MKVLVLGATGGTGRAIIGELLSRGHEVTAFARRRDAVTDARVHVFEGDATDAGDVERAVQGHDAVVVALGIRENPLAVRLRGSRRTPINVRSAGTENVVAAMRAHGVRKLVVQTTYGTGDTRGQLPFKWKMIFSLLLKPQIADTEQQDRLVRASGLDWVLVQPVALTDEPIADTDRPFVSTTGDARGMAISRATVARFIRDAVETPTYVRQAVALSSVS